MEHLGPPAFNPHLKRVLKSFQNSAVNSLSGPSNFVSGWGDPSKLSPPSELEDYQMQSLQRLKMLNGTLVKTPEKLFSPTAGLVAQSPLFLPMDNTSGDKADTILEGEKIACFIVGGEKRLCLPQILNTVLREFSLQQINNICDELHIFCSRCNPEQLQMLKMNEVLPWTAPSCGLITKTDAERLCNALLHRTPEKSRDPPTPNSFKVYHECFGKCKGIFNPELYASPYAKCIECVDCHGMFSPQKFVCHSHKAQENRTCHWGFDSANWRSYLLLSKDQDRKDRFQDVLDAMKARFDFTSRFKRKESESDETLDCNKEESKKVKLDDGTYEYRGMSAFRPWSPSMLSAIKNGKAAITIPTSFGDGIAQALPSYLHTGPPVLLNPERVIPHSESSRYERHFAPNVSLAPQPYQKKSQDEDKDREPVNSRTELPKCSSPKHLMAEELRQSEDEEDYDIDVSSDTESSLKSSDSPSSVPSTPEETLRPNLISPNEADLACSKDRETELAILTQALEIRNGESDDVRKKLSEDFSKLQARRAEREQNLLKTLEELRQELEYVKLSKKEKMREAAEAKRELRQEIDKLRDEQDRRCREASEERKQLQREIEALRNQGRSSPDVMKVKAKYKGQIEQLRSKVLHYETSNLQRKQEVNTLRAELRKLGKELPETKPTLASPEGSVSNGSESDQSPAGSPKVNGKPGSLSATPVSAEAVS